MSVIDCDGQHYASWLAVQNFIRRWRKGSTPINMISSLIMNYENEWISGYFCITIQHLSSSHNTRVVLMWSLYLNKIPFSPLTCTFIYTAGCSKSNQIFCSVGGTCVVRMNNFNRQCIKHRAWILCNRLTARSWGSAIGVFVPCRSVL